MTPEQMTPRSREEELLIALLNDEPDPVADMVPRSNVEHYLKECIELVSCGNCPEPKSRVDILLRSLRDKLIAGGGGGGGGGEEDKYKNVLKQVIEGTITEMTEDDFAGATKIKNSLFYNQGMTSVKIPDTVTSIGTNTFYGSEFETITIPGSVTELGESCFRYCRQLKSIYFNKRIKTDVFCFMSSKIENIYIQDLTEWLESDFADDKMWNNGTEKTKVWLNGQLIENMITTDQATKVGPNVFSKYEHLKSAYITENIKEISNSAFSGCGDLESVQFEEGLTTIGYYAFSHTAIQTVQIPNSVTIISSSAFSYCDNLASVTIGTSIQRIHSTAFYKSGIKTLTMLSENPPSLSDVNAFSENPIEQIIVPVGCAEAYKTATNWSEYADYIVEATE